MAAASVPTRTLADAGFLAVPTVSMGLGPIRPSIRRGS